MMGLVCQGGQQVTSHTGQTRSAQKALGALGDPDSGTMVKQHAFADGCVAMPIHSSRIG